MNRLLAARPRPLIYAITDRTLLKAPNQTAALISYIESLIDAGVDLIQIRERDLDARTVFEIAKAAASAALNHSMILVNDRSDIAASAGVGVHLTTRSLEATLARRVLDHNDKEQSRSSLIGVSTHHLEDAIAAENSGADFIVFGPIFETSSKAQFGPPVGLDPLQEVTSRVRIPVLGLGGIDRSNYREVLAAGAQGIAGISMFTNQNDLPSLVKEIKSGNSPR